MSSGLFLSDLTKLLQSHRIYNTAIFTGHDVKSVESPFKNQIHLFNVLLFTYPALIIPYHTMTVYN